MRQDFLHLRNLVAHGMIAEKLLANPDLVKRAYVTCERWLEEQGDVPALQEWRTILGDVKDHIDSADDKERRIAYLTLLQVLLDPSEEGMRRRSSSPFSDALTELERSAVYEALRK